MLCRGKDYGEKRECYVRGKRIRGDWKMVKWHERRMYGGEKKMAEERSESGGETRLEVI